MNIFFTSILKSVRKPRGTKVCLRLARLLLNTHTHTHIFFTLAFCFGSVIALPFCICIDAAALLVGSSV